MLGNRGWHHNRPHPGIDGVDQDCLFVLNQSSSQWYDDTFEVKAEYMSYVGESARSVLVKRRFQLIRWHNLRARYIT